MAGEATRIFVAEPLWIAMVWMPKVPCLHGDSRILTTSSDRTPIKLLKQLSAKRSIGAQQHYILGVSPLFTQGSG